jgi:hypothetical protein
MNEETLRIAIDGRWELSDLYEFSKNFEQCYFAYLAIMGKHAYFEVGTFDRAFFQYPWQGGYSTVNFYRALKRDTPRDMHPRVVSIRYASPGYIELGLFITAALAVAKAIKELAISVDSVTTTYRNIHKALHDRKLLRFEGDSHQLDIEMRNIQIAVAKEGLRGNELDNTEREMRLKLLAYDIEEKRVEHLLRLGIPDPRKLDLEVHRAEAERSNREFLVESNAEMDKVLGLEKVDSIANRTGSDLISLQIKLSLFRRMQVLAEYEKDGKTKL